MGAFGDRLRREREMRGVTLDEISISTRISRRHLEALEREEFDNLPGGIFNKGFVRAYAKFLGIDEEQAVADYLAANSPEPQTEEAFPLNVPDKPARRSTQPVTSVILALLALGIIAGGWFYRAKYHPQHQAKGVVNAPAPRTSSSTLPEPAPQQGPPSVSAIPGEVPATQTPQSQLPAQEQSINGSFTVRIRATEKSWVSMKADGHTVVERELGVGEEQSAKAEKQITLTVGNAAGVEVSFNGASQGLLGEKGKVRTVTFTPHGREVISSVPETAPRLQ